MESIVIHANVVKVMKVMIVKLILMNVQVPLVRMEAPVKMRSTVTSVYAPLAIQVCTVERTLMSVQAAHVTMVENAEIW